MDIVGLDHVQVAAPSGCEAQARRFYASDPWRNRLELVAANAAAGSSVQVERDALERRRT